MDKTANLLRSYVDQGIIPGFVVSTLKDRRVERSFYGNITQGEAISDPSLVYDIASLTKLFTTTRILQLIQDGKFTLDTSLACILSNFSNPAITIENLLLHNSGFSPSAKGRYTMDAKELRQSILRCDDLVGQAGVDTVYSCINFVLLGFVIEHFDGDLESSFKTNIYQKCDMNQTCFGPVIKDVAPSKTVNGIEIRGVVSDSTARALGGKSGNAGLFSNVLDLEKFVYGYMNRTLLNDATLEIITKLNIKSRTLGWNLLFNETGSLYHTGFTGPSIYLNLDKKLALIIMTNRNIPVDNDTYVSKRNEVLLDFINQFEN